MARRFWELAVSDVANQFATPLKSLTGFAVSVQSARSSKHVSEAVVDKLNLAEDAKVLEIGYGRGHGIAAALARMPRGIVFGLERSPYMEEVTRKRFVLEEREQGRLELDRTFDLRHLAYPTNIFDAVFHVDVYYFLKQESMPDICRELLRTLRPEGVLMCGLQMSRLEKLEKRGLLTASQWDPLRYMQCLEPAGFVDVKMEYVSTPRGEVQIISSRKPPDDDGSQDPAVLMARLARDMKREMLKQKLTAGGVTLTPEELDELLERKD